MTSVELAGLTQQVLWAGFQDPVRVNAVDVVVGAGRRRPVRVRHGARVGVREQGAGAGRGGGSLKALVAEALSFVAPIAYTLDWLMFCRDRSKHLTVGIVSVFGVVQNGPRQCVAN